MIKKIMAMTLALCMIAPGMAMADEKPADYPLSSNIKDAAYYGDLKEFSAELLDRDEEFTQDDLADYDLTMINFWATWCGPCLMEMPELAEFEKSVPSNVKVITACLSYNDEDEIRKINESIDYEGDCMVSIHGDLAALCNNLQGYPTTLFFDSEGNAVGSGVVGGKQNFVVFYTSMVNDILEQMGLEKMGASEETEAEETEAEETETE